MIHYTKTAQISRKQDEHNIYVTMKTMSPPCYHHNSFVGTHALGHTMHGYTLLYVLYIYIYIYVCMYVCVCGYIYILPSRKEITKIVNSIWLKIGVNTYIKYQHHIWLKNTMKAFKDFR